jgi:hypothetical protein
LLFQVEDSQNKFDQHIEKKDHVLYFNIMKKKNGSNWDYIFKKPIQKDEVPNDIKGLYEESIIFFNKKSKEFQDNTKFPTIQDALGKAKFELSKTKTDPQAQFKLYIEASDNGNVEVKYF